LSQETRDVGAISKASLPVAARSLSLEARGLHLVLIGYLTYRSGYAPRVLGVLLVSGDCDRYPAGATVVLITQWFLPLGRE
jgi:Domain of unknown function (DUF4386)